MKQIYGVIIMILFLFHIACKDSDPIAPTGPSMEFLDSGGYFVFGDDSVPKENFFGVHIIATKGSSSLESLSITEDGLLIDTIRIKMADANGLFQAMNPLQISSSDESEFEYAVTVAIPDAGDFEYTFTLWDENQLEVEKSLNLHFYEIPVGLAIVGSVPDEITVGSWLPVDLFIERGTNYVDTLSVFEDNVAITDPTRIRTGTDLQPVFSMPVQLPLNSGSYTFRINVFVNKGGIQTFTFRVTDRDGYSDEVSKTITAT